MSKTVLILLGLLLLTSAQSIRKNTEDVKQEIIEELIEKEKGIEADVEILKDAVVKTQKNKAFPTNVIGGWLCGNGSVTAQSIIDAKFNVVYVSFYDLVVTNGVVSIEDNRCCDSAYTFDIAKDLLAAGVTVMISIGGDGCEGREPTGITDVSDAAIVAGFEAFRESTGVDWSGLDFDWEGSNAGSTAEAINKVGLALRPAGYFVTAVPMSSQFVPGGLQGWKTLDPAAIDAVAIQWYQGGCVGTQSCPCWGNHSLFDTDCPGFKQSYMQQARKCGTVQWIQGFQDVGGFNWNANQIIVGAKSWCGGDQPSACTGSDTGIWGYQQMASILSESGVRGVSMWDINDYFIDGYFEAGNSIANACNWNNNIYTLWVEQKEVEVGINEPAYCANYEGPYATNCNPNPW